MQTCFLVQFPETPVRPECWPPLPDGFCCQTYFCETIPDLVRAVKDCPGEVLIFGCGNGTVTSVCVTTHSECADDFQVLIEKAAEILLKKLGGQ